MAERDYDLVFYGASGFTGKQAVKYFARHAPGLRWAIAGRNREKLEAMRAQIGAPASMVPVLVADSGDQAAVDAIVSRTRVMLSTAGPFALYGSSVVDACVRFKTHYVDISGETGWVRELSIATISERRSRARALFLFVDSIRYLPISVLTSWFAIYKGSRSLSEARINGLGEGRSLYMTMLSGG